MRFRGKSIRRKIVALLLVPLVTLTAIWGFATVLTGEEAAQLLGNVKVVDQMSYPVEDTARVLEHERRQTLIYLADPRAANALQNMRSSRRATDAMVGKVRRNARAEAVRDNITADADERLTAVLEGFEGLDSLRSSVEAGGITGTTALDLYDELIDPCYAFLMTVQGVNDLELSKQGQALVSVARARELLSREDAVIAAALVADRLNSTDIRQISDLIAQRTLLYDNNLPLLPDEDRGRFERYWQGNDTRSLRVAEQAFAQATPGVPRAVSGTGDWNQMAGKVLGELADRDNAADDRYQDRVKPVAVNVLVRAGVAGVLGLAALLFSVIVSVRIGRSLIRDLRGLRTEAHEASGVRLPSVMRRLAGGEQVDVETEAPRLEYDRNEIGQVGQALNTLQRAAVEAAVRQAELRRGVSEVFVNLARRSQVLLHKQLTLLDSMERRTEDTDELADLFRLDHLTTRMRRHAEGLVILSGAAPSRQWRKPVQLMDVVRASVAEVEDYERIEVRRLPRIAVAGPAVADLTHLIAELLENATVFSPPHTAVQVLGERVANGFTLEIHDRGLGMAPEVLLDANLRLSETPEFELSDTDRLGLFVVSRLAQRQNVRVSLQPSPYGGTTAVVFIPDALLTDASETDTGGLRLEPSFDEEPPSGRGTGPGRATPLSKVAAQELSDLPSALLDGPVELEPPVRAAGAGTEFHDFPGALDDEDSERGGLFRPRRPLSKLPGGQHQQASDTHRQHDGPARPNDPADPGPLPRRQTPKLVSSHGRPVAPSRAREADTTERRTGAPPEPAVQSDLPRRRRPAQAAAPLRDTEPGGSALPRRVRQASLAPQLKNGPDRRSDRDSERDGNGPFERDADEVRSRMASLQRGWRRGREENAAGDDGPGGSAQGTTLEGDGR
ncbi:histidine kinase [Streptomyces sulfonofaciens]|uniref:histidine kinase n=1 Tax=Streptomyces sulfonofaciens TaxID=68272 RepID=A0A919G0Z2_9ACTN|nr:nitrate- and nitrite sensing domain-containing protein [Streptomyces sulfonofaciens]GHH76055.1 histidine kinase [Streptomyces sulfonofaciens]